MLTSSRTVGGRWGWGGCCHHWCFLTCHNSDAIDGVLVSVSVLSVIQVMVSSYIVLRTVQSTLHFSHCRPVHSNSTSLGSIQTICNYCLKTIVSHLSITVYGQLLVYTAE